MWGQKHLIQDYLQKWGSLASCAVLNPEYQIFTTPNLNGLIGYRLESGCAIVLGEPICDATHRLELMTAFHKFCQEKQLNVIYLVVSEKFAEEALKSHCKIMIEYGEELYLDPCSEDPTKRGHGGLVRNKLKQALSEGIVIKEYLDNDPAFESHLKNIETEWTKKRNGPQVYISHGSLFENRQNKRWFYAEKDKNVVGILVLDRLEALEGWLLSSVIFTTSAPRGTSESLVMHAMHILADENSHYLSFGMVPLEKFGKIQGLNRFTSGVLKLSFKFISKIFQLNRKKMFWQKFLPKSRPSYLLFDKSISLKNLLALKRALNVGF